MIIIMSRLQIKENLLIDSYINHMHIKTRNELMKGLEALSPAESNFAIYETAVELGSIFMYNFGKTNKAEFDEFIQNNHIQFSDSKIKSFFAKSFNQTVEVDCEFEDLLDKTIGNYDVAKKQAARFLAEIGIPEGYINAFKKNTETIQELGLILAKDYFFFNKKEPIKNEFEGKHLYTVFKSLGDKYMNMTIGFSDNHNWKLENDMVIMPKNGFMIHGGKHADLISSYGGGYELSALMRDKEFFKTLKDDLKNGYFPDNMHSEVIRASKTFNEESDLEKSKIQERLKLRTKNNI